MARSFRLILVLCAVVFSLALAGCAAQTAEMPAVQEPTQVPAEVVKTVEVEKSVQETAELPAPTSAPQAFPTPVEPASKPTLAPLASPTLAQPTYAPTQPVPMSAGFVEERIVELEWPPRMRLGDSDVVRLSLVPSQEGYTVQTDFPEHQTQTQDVQVTRLSGYDLLSVARLEGVGFEISPAQERVQNLPVAEPVTWQWSLQPRAPGQQRLVVILSLRWVPAAGVQGMLRETVIYSRGLNVQVSSFFGLTRGQAMTGGLLGLLLGGGVSLFTLVGLVLPQRSNLETATPNLALVIEPHPGLSLSNQETALLRGLFRRYARLVIEGEFLSGYSGARTILALPIRLDGRADAYTIVKVGERQSVQQEYANYEKFVKDTLPPITARIQHAPVTVRGGDKAAIQYTFIGAPGHTPASLHQALLANPDPALLRKLFETFGPNWWMQRRAYTFRLSQEYDRLLPTHYVLEPVGGRGQALDGRASVEEQGFQVGDLVTLHNFPILERRADGRSLSLQGSLRPGRPALRARWLSLSEPEGATGRVIATRSSLLQSFVTGMDLLGLPDPLARLPKLYNESVSGSQSTIHGDLNLENVLVGPGDFVWLIDFALTRDGHTLFDFAHLGAEMVAHIAASRVESAQEYLAILALNPFSPAQQNTGSLAALFSGLYEIARNCLFNPAQPREYHLALYMACLGALKFQNLGPFQKYLLYLTAAHLACVL